METNKTLSRFIGKPVAEVDKELTQDGWDTVDYNINSEYIWVHYGWSKSISAWFNENKIVKGIKIMDGYYYD